MRNNSRAEANILLESGAVTGNVVLLAQGYYDGPTIEGYLSNRWADWFEGMTIRDPRCGETILHGVIDDQAALYGILNKIQGLNLTLVAVNRVPARKDVSQI